MKKFIGYILLTLVFVSCGPKSGQFRIDGRIKNLNQGEFYVYSPDGGLSGIDTIQVSDGKFRYETKLDGRATYVIIFPNFSEQPVFGESGTIAKLNADASRLREMEITGTETNDQMTAFRMRTNGLSMADMKVEADSFIQKSPSSPISSYLLRRYFIDTASPDYRRALELSDIIAKSDKDNIRMVMLNKQLKSLKSAPIGSKLPSFSGTDLGGNSVGSKDLKAVVNVIYAWATWNKDSQGLQRELKRLKRKHGEDSLAIMSLCIDAGVEQCRKYLKKDTTLWITICDEKMWQSPILKTLGINTLPGNIVVDEDGTILARNLSADKMKKKVNELLKN